MKKKRITAILVTAILLGMLAVYAKGVEKKPVFSVREFGAKGDGKTLDTKAIQKAFDECEKAGGGTVRLPKGIYLSGAVWMKSKTTLVIEKGAILEGSKDLDDYPIKRIRFAGTEQKCHASLLNATNAHNITITGKGLVSGSGIGRSRKPTGPRVIEFIRCRDVLLENITVTNQARWTIHPLYCTNVIARNLLVLVTPGGRNGDGLNPDSCNNVLITNCTFRTKDDCIAIKSGKNQQGVDIGIPCENITVTKCTMARGYGAVCLGSEMSGGIKNITIKDCVFIGKALNRGIDIKTRKGRGGIVENLVVSNIKAFNLQNTILIRMDYKNNAGRLIEGKAGIPTIRNISFTDIEIHGKKMGKIRGMKENPIQGLTLRNIISDGSKKLELENVKGLVIDNVRNNNSDKAVKMKNVKLKD